MDAARDSGDVWWTVAGNFRNTRSLHGNSEPLQGFIEYQQMSLAIGGPRHAVSAHVSYRLDFERPPLGFGLYASEKNPIGIIFHRFGEIFRHFTEHPPLDDPAIGQLERSECPQCFCVLEFQRSDRRGIGAPHDRAFSERWG